MDILTVADENYRRSRVAACGNRKVKTLGLIKNSARYWEVMANVFDIGAEMVE